MSVRSVSAVTGVSNVRGEVVTRNMMKSALGEVAGVKFEERHFIGIVDKTEFYPGSEPGWWHELDVEPPFSV